MTPDNNMNRTTLFSLSIAAPYKWRYETTRALSLLWLNLDHLPRVKALTYIHYSHYPRDANGSSKQCSSSLT